MSFVIRCENKNCCRSTKILDGYNNEDDIQISIIGDYTIEIKCTFCGNEVVITNGSII